MQSVEQLRIDENLALYKDLMHQNLDSMRMDIYLSGVVGG